MGAAGVTITSLLDLVDLRLVPLVIPTVTRWTSLSINPVAAVTPSLTSYLSGSPGIPWAADPS